MSYPAAEARSYSPNVANAHKALREKYGALKSHPTRAMPTNDGGAIEWGWNEHNLHVFYVPDSYVDTIRIELDSVTRARLEDNRTITSAN